MNARFLELQLPRIMQGIVVGSAVLALPTDLFSPLWLLLFALPGVLFLWLSTGSRERRLGFAERMGVAVATVIGLSIAIYRTDAAPVAQAALTYLLLPPLAYASLRRRPLDVLHSLFLSFCLLVISSILRREMPGAPVFVFAAGAAFVLQSETRRLAVLGRHATRVNRLNPTARLMARSSVTVACVLAFSGILGLLRALPLPGSDRDDPNGPAARVGISNSFDLRSFGGGPLDLIDDELVAVRAPTGAVASDLYLRCGYFDVAGLDRWLLDERRRFQPLDLERRPWRLAPVRGPRTTSLEVHRLEGLSGLIYVPPGLRHLQGPLAAHGHTQLEAFFEPASSGPVTYHVRYQDLRGLANNRPATRPISGLTRLPRELSQRTDLRDLSRQYVAEAGDDPTRLALAIARGLQDRCRYSLEAPTGDSPHLLDNFLFGSRSGYCMHFASALAILLRFADVPCRIAVGLYGGRENEDDPRQRIFGSRDAHAWVEIPLDGLGWVVFDATPAATLRSSEARLPNGFDIAAYPGPGRFEIEREVKAGQSLWSRIPLDVVWPWLALLSLLTVTRLRPRRHGTARGTAAPITPEIHAARRALQKILTALSQHTRPRTPGETLEAYAAELERDGELGIDLDAVQTAFEAYQAIRFGGYALDPIYRDELRAGLRAARGE